MDNVELMVKLFETLKESSDKSESTLRKLIEQQHSLISLIEYMPVKELHEALKDHSKVSSIEIGTCTDTVNLTSDSILEKVKIIENKIGKMILVVVVAFAVLSMGYLIGRMTLEKSVMEQQGSAAGHQEIIDSVEELNAALKRSIEKEFSNIRKEMAIHHKESDETIRKEIKKVNPN
jgi:hypothetical protein